MTTRVWVLNAATGATVKVLNLPWGSAPVGVVLTPDRATGYLALQGSGQIQKFTSQSSTLGALLALGTTPRALAVTADGRKLLVTQFVSTGNAGTVRTVDLATFASCRDAAAASRGQHARRLARRARPA